MFRNERNAKGAVAMPSLSLKPVISLARQGRHVPATTPQVTSQCLSISIGTR